MSIAKIFIFVLFLLFGFGMVPLMIKLFLYLQNQIGNSGHWVVTFLNNNFWLAVLLVWGIFLLGFLIAWPAMVKDGFFEEFRK